MSEDLVTGVHREQFEYLTDIPNVSVYQVRESNYPDPGEKINGHEVYYSCDKNFHPDIAVVTPVYWREFASGNLKDHLHSFLLQETKNGTTIELSYLTNLRAGKPPQLVEGYKHKEERTILDPEPASDENVEKYHLTKKMVKLLFGLSALQSLTVSKNNEGKTRLKNRLIEDYPEYSDVIDLAERIASEIRISCVDISDCSEYSELGYFLSGNNLEYGIRTIGVDFVRKRSPKIIQLMDADTIPASKRTLRNLAEYYSKNPQEKFVKSAVGYQIPKEDFEDSVTESLARSADYAIPFKTKSGGGTSTTQISFRGDLAKDVNFVSLIRNYPTVIPEMDTHVPGFMGDWEDEDTFKHLLLLSGVNIHNYQVDEVGFLTMDRIEGDTDGDTRFTHGYTNFENLVAEVDKEVIKLKLRIDALPEILKNEAMETLDKSMKKNRDFVVRTHRLYRYGARNFIRLLETGDISVQENQIIFSENAKKDPNFKSIKRYSDKFPKLILDATEPDVDYLKYILGMKPIYEGKLDDKKRAIREWFGSEDERDTKRVSRLIPVQIKLQAISDIYKSYFGNTDLMEKIKKSQKGEKRFSGDEILVAIKKIHSAKDLDRGYEYRTRWYDQATTNTTQ